MRRKAKRKFGIFLVLLSILLSGCDIHMSAEERVGNHGQEVDPSESLASETEAFAAAPFPAPAKIPVEIRLLENDAVSRAALVKVAPEAERRFAAHGERLPAELFTLKAYYGLATRSLRTFGNLVVGIIRKEGIFGASAAGCNRSVTGCEGPQIARTHNIHEERRKSIHVLYLEILGILHLHCFGSHRPGQGPVAR